MILNQRRQLHNVIDTGEIPTMAGF